MIDAWNKVFGHKSSTSSCLCVHLCVRVCACVSVCLSVCAPLLMILQTHLSVSLVRPRPRRSFKTRPNYCVSSERVSCVKISQVSMAPESQGQARWRSTAGCVLAVAVGCSVSILPVRSKGKAPLMSSARSCHDRDESFVIEAPTQCGDTSL